MKTTMTPEIYESKRNDLISMLDSILTTATGLSAPARKELEETAAKLKRNSFEIVLVGEFQGGKSTTFDTICDGREISPRGIGIKTSACKISAQSVPADQPERADLTWKSDEELMLTMIGIVRDNLVNDKDAYALFTKKDKNGIDVLPSLSDPRIHKLASKAIHAEWERYNANKANYDPDQKGLLDILLISTLILNFCNSPELAQLKAKPSVAIDELKSLVVFPQDWAERWLVGGEKAQWTFSEVPFVFLGSISCHIHCANLERLGCVITDCPGLFAGPWDTAVAQKAMMQADAILSLIGGQRAVTEADLRALTEIRKTQQGHKVFFAINSRLSKANIAGPIRQADFSMIRQRGYEIDNAETIDVFNSLLAFDSKTTPADEKRWKKEVSAALAVYLGLDLTDEKDLQRAKELRENRPELYKASDFPSILAKIETDVVTKKFKSILVNGGTNKASKALDALNGDLSVKEMKAKKDLDEVEKEVEVARKKLVDFQQFVNETVATELQNPSGSDLVARDYLQSVFIDNIEAIADSVCPIVAERTIGDAELLKTIKEAVRSQNGAPKEAYASLNEPIKDAALTIINPAFEGWVANVKQGQNDTFRNVYGNSLRNLDFLFQEKWKNVVHEDTSGFLDDLDCELDFAITDIPGLDIIGGDADEMQKAILSVSGMDNVMSWVVSIIVGILAGFFCAGPIGVAILVILAIVVVVIARTQLANYLAQKLRPKIIDVLRQQFENSAEMLTASFKDNVLRLMLDKVAERYRSSLKTQLDAFNHRVEETLTMKRKRLDEQNRIAAEAKKVREEQIEPARKRIAEFHKGLEPFFEADSKQEA